nr:hypothetical protein [Treponema sp.]
YLKKGSCQYVIVTNENIDTIDCSVSMKNKKISCIYNVLKKNSFHFDKNQESLHLVLKAYESRILLLGD